MYISVKTCVILIIEHISSLYNNKINFCQLLRYDTAYFLRDDMCIFIKAVIVNVTSLKTMNIYS